MICAVQWKSPISMPTLRSRWVELAAHLSIGVRWSPLSVARGMRFGWFPRQRKPRRRERSEPGNAVSFHFLPTRSRVFCLLACIMPALIYYYRCFILLGKSKKYQKRLDFHDEFLYLLRCCNLVLARDLPNGDVGWWKGLAAGLLVTRLFSSL